MTTKHCPICKLPCIAVMTQTNKRFEEKAYHHDAFPNGWRKPPCVQRCSTAGRCERRIYRRRGNSVAVRGRQ